MPYLTRTCLLALLLNVPGCYAATSAALHCNQDQPDLRGVIDGGDGTHMVVRNAAGEQFRVPRAGVLDVDHPTWPIAVGFVAMGIPGTLYGLYLWNESVQSAGTISDAARWQSVPQAPAEVEVVP